MTLQTDTLLATITRPRGTMKKSMAEMTPSERELFYVENARNVRERLFAIGQPVVCEKNGQIVAEYADGTVTILEPFSEPSL